jgi:hypothetical protein
MTRRFRVRQSFLYGKQCYLKSAKCWTMYMEEKKREDMEGKYE